MATQQPRRPVPPAWIKRAGLYENLEPDHPILQSGELKCHYDLLYLEASVRRAGKIRIYLQPLNDDEAIILGLGRFAGEMITAHEINDIQHLEIEGSLFHKT